MLCESKGNLESSFELTYQTKRQLTFIGFALRRFAAGIDYMIIIPSLWFYLDSFNTRYYFLGLVIAADSLVAFFLSPWIQRLAEKWHKIRVLGFLANLFQIGGSMIYALPLYFYMPLVGRLVSGIGVSFGGALYGEIKRLTNHEERNRVMIIMEGVRLFGIVIGPGMNFFLKDFDLKFGPWVIDHRTAPGFFMAILWLLVQVVHIFTVYDLTDDLTEDRPVYKELASDDDDEELRSYDDERPKPHLPIDETAHYEDKSSIDEATGDEDDEKPSEKIQVEASNDYNPSEKIEMDSSDDENKNTKELTKPPEMSKPPDDEAAKDEVHSTYSGKVADREAITSRAEGQRSIRDLVTRRDVMLILVAQFLMFFNQTAFETLVLIIGVERLDFTITILSTVFILAGVEMVVVIVVVWSANKSLDAKYLLLTCLSAGILASFARLAVTFTEPHSAGCLAMTMLMGVFTIIGTPITSIAGKSLLPKMTRVETHGFYQGAFATAQHLGLVTGPLVASVMYNYFVLFSSLMVVIFLVVYMIALSVVEKFNIPAQGCGR